MEIRGSAPDFDESLGVELICGFVESSPRAHVVGATVGEQQPRHMATRAGRFAENHFGSFRGFGKLTMDQVRTRHRLQRVEILDDAVDNLI